MYQMFLIALLLHGRQYGSHLNNPGQQRPGQLTTVSGPGALVRSSEREVLGGYVTRNVDGTFTIGANFKDGKEIGAADVKLDRFERIKPGMVSIVHGLPIMNEEYSKKYPFIHALTVERNADTSLKSPYRLPNVPDIVLKQNHVTVQRDGQPYLNESGKKYVLDLLEADGRLQSFAPKDLPLSINDIKRSIADLIDNDLKRRPTLTESSNLASSVALVRGVGLNQSYQELRNLMQQLCAHKYVLEKDKKDYLAYIFQQVEGLN